MDEDPYIIAVWMAEEERLRQKKKAARRREQKLLYSYQPFQYDQRPNQSIGKWLIFGAGDKSMKALLVAAIVVILFVPSLSPGYKQVWSGSGNLIREESGDLD